MNKLKRAGIVLLVFLMVFGMTGCKKSEAPKRAEKEVKKEVKEKKEEPKKDEVPANQNLLTGLGDLTDGAIGKRPVAVMVNNVQDAMPQYGVAKADIIYEVPVEGDVTRLMALYADYTTVPKICAVRSCRY